MGVITGRPTTYTADIADMICERLSTSRRGLEDLCSDADLPGSSTVWRWLAKYPDFREKYERAREFQTELMYDEIERIVNEPLPESAQYDALGNYLGDKIDAGISMAEMQRRKLAVDVMKFKLVKLQPKRFGERKDIDLNVKMTHQVSADQFSKILEAAKAAPQIEAPAEDYEEADVVYDTHSVEDDFAGLDEGFIDELG